MVIDDSAAEVAVIPELLFPLTRLAVTVDVPRLLLTLIPLPTLSKASFWETTKVVLLTEIPPQVLFRTTLLVTYVVRGEGVLALGRLRPHS